MPEDIAARLKDLRESKDQLVAYCATKLRQGDYHGVADAAMDLRETDAMLAVYEAFKAEALCLKLG